MGCSSSTQTRAQGATRAPTKTMESNGAKKSASEICGQITDDIETIPDQTKLVPLTENEPSTNKIPPEEQVQEAVEFDAKETALTVEKSAEDFLPVDKEPAQAEEPTEVNSSQDSSVVEGETEEADEASNHEESETKEDETEHSVDASEPEMDTSNEDE